MADANIKKVVIPKSELPAVDAASLTYNLRYRIISEDKNRISHWSKIYAIDADTIVPISTYTLAVDNAHKLITVAWQKGDYTAFDIYIRWSGTHTETLYPYQYVDSTTQGSYQAVIPADIPDPVNGGTEPTKHVRVLVQTPTYPKEIVTSAKLFETAKANT